MHGLKLLVAVTVLLCATRSGALPARSTACINEADDNSCDTWASAGECEANPSFMKTSCAASCDSCSWEDTYCTDLAKVHKPAKSQPGDIAATFERAITFTDFAPTVHSRPGPSGVGPPWVITFDNFVSDEEAQAFIDTTDHHFKRSLAGDMVSPVRTSQQAWCQCAFPSRRLPSAGAWAAARFSHAHASALGARAPDGFPGEMLPSGIAHASNAQRRAMADARTA